MNRENFLVIAFMILLTLWRILLFGFSLGDSLTNCEDLNAKDLERNLDILKNLIQREPPRLPLEGQKGTEGLSDPRLLHTFKNSGCHLNSLFTRMQRIHLIFNEEPKLAKDLQWDSIEHAGLAIREEVEEFLRKELALEPHEVLKERVQYGTAEWWQDVLFGYQYLIDVQLSRGQAAPLSRQLRVVDDRRYQLWVYDDRDEYGPPGSEKRKVNIIAALFNRAQQLTRWGESLERLDKLDKDQIRICLADYRSTDINPAEVLGRTGVEFEVLTMGGEFSKTDGLNACLRRVTAEDEIVFTTDIDVLLPKDILTKIKRYTRKGLQVYAPIVMYESCTWSTGECW